MKIPFKKKVLKNGMTLLFEKREVPVVSIAFAVRNGGENETEAEKGISHFIEHMLYKGTPSRSSSQIAEEIEKNGGELNGFTSESVTAYWCKIPSKSFQFALDVLSDMVKNPLFDEKEIEKERQVIFEEIKMYKDNPRMHVLNEIKEALYEKPFGMNLAGTFESMGSLGRKELLEKFKEVYQPNNMILCVVGNADFNEIVDFAEKNFLKNKGSVRKANVTTKNASKTEARKGIDQANLVFAHHSPLAGDDKNYAAEILNTILAGGMSSRLFKEIREKRNLAYSVKGDCDTNKNYSYSIIYIGTSKENIEQVKKLILEEYQKIADSLSEEELEQVKKQLIGNYQISMEDSQNQMVNLLNAETSTSAEDFYKFEENVSKAILDDVKYLAKQALKNHSFFALVPE